MGIAFNAGEGGQMCRDIGGSSFVQRCRQAFREGRSRFPPPGTDMRDAGNPDRGANPSGGSPSGGGTTSQAKLKTNIPEPTGGRCGKGKQQVKTRFNIGCRGKNYTGPGGAIGDMFFAFIRFLAVGVGIVVAASIIWAGIGYASSQGNPEATAKARDRIQTSLIALLIYLFTFAIVNWVVPGGLLL